MTSLLSSLVATIALAANPGLPHEPDHSSSKPAPNAAVSQIYFVGPEGLTIQWDVTAPGRFDSEQLVAPSRYNFPQGALYRLKLTNIPGRAGVELFPTLEVAPGVPRSEAFLAHNAVPVEFTDEDFDAVMKGTFLTKVIYLPDPEFQDPALAGVGTLVSTRLDRGLDPIVNAGRRGAILAIVRLGDKDLGNRPGTGTATKGKPAQSEPRTPAPAGGYGAAPGKAYPIPVSPYFQKKEEDAFWNHKRYDAERVPILDPIQPGSAEICLDAPSEEEVMRKLQMARPASLSTVERNKVRIVTEPIQDSIDPPRVMPQVGPVQVHHVHFKCIVYFTEVTHVLGPTPRTTVEEDCQEVIYLDHDHLHRVGKSEAPAPPAAPKK